MVKTYPGTTVEVSRLSVGDSRTLFDSIFLTGGITLSQMSLLTGLEPYVIQNWVKRGFVTPPQKRTYSREQFARIVIINMLKEELQIERICKLIRLLGGKTDSPADDLIGDPELYHRYVDLLSLGVSVSDRASVEAAARRAAEDFTEPFPGAREQLVSILRVMIYAHAATELRENAEDVLSALLG